MTGRKKWKTTSLTLSHAPSSAKPSETMPPVAKYPVLTAMSRQTSPSSKSGTLRSVVVAAAVPRSVHCPFRAAAQIPSGMAISQASAVAGTVSSSVLRARRQRSGPTGPLCTTENPSSPRPTDRSHRTYFCGSD